MKTFAVILIFLQLLCFGKAISSNIEDTTYLNKTPLLLKKTIEERVQYPKDAINNNIEGIVSASLLVDSTGRVIIKKINGHPDLVNDIVKQIAMMEFPAGLASNKEIIIRFRFDIR
jgi:hypothetical protein